MRLSRPDNDKHIPLTGYRRLPCRFGVMEFAVAVRSSYFCARIAKIVIGWCVNCVRCFSPSSKSDALRLEEDMP